MLRVPRLSLKNVLEMLFVDPFAGVCLQLKSKVIPR